MDRNGHSKVLRRYGRPASQRGYDHWSIRKPLCFGKCQKRQAEQEAKVQAAQNSVKITEQQLVNTQAQAEASALKLEQAELDRQQAEAMAQKAELEKQALATRNLLMKIGAGLGVVVVVGGLALVGYKLLSSTPATPIVTA